MNPRELFACRSVLALVTALALIAPRARACDCAAPPPPKESLAQSAAVFAGTVTKIERDAQRYTATVTFEVTRAWKGVSDRTVTVTTPLDGGACGFDFSAKPDDPTAPGGRFLVYALADPDDPDHRRLSTNICTRTRHLDEAKEDLEALECDNKDHADSADLKTALKRAH